MILIDVFFDNDDMVLWCKDAEKDIFLKDSFEPVIYLRTLAEPTAMQVLSQQKAEKVRKKDFAGGEIDVLKVTFASRSSFFYEFREIERKLRAFSRFYNADIPLEEMYLFERGWYPFMEAKVRQQHWRAARQGVSLTGCRAGQNRGEAEILTVAPPIMLLPNDNDTILEYGLPKLKVLKLDFNDDNVICNDVIIDDKKEFIALYKTLDPDVIFIKSNQKALVDFFAECRKIDHAVKLNRYGEDNFTAIAGNSYFSYGRYVFRETPVYLKGRLLINADSFMQPDFSLFSLIEGARICRMRIQRLATHSVGAAVTNLLTHQAYADGYLIPYRSGIYERFKSFKDLVAVDRGALVLEPYVGLHKEVAELDFVSMYPSIISHFNLSPETLNCSCCPENRIMETPYHFCTKKKGIVPKVCEFLLRRRAYFKSRKDLISESKSSYLKWLLVVIFGFQAFKSKKIGCIEVHEAINALAREILLKAIRTAEQEGFEVIHGIVDSLYVKKKDITEKGASSLARAITEKTGLPIEVKALYKFIVFLPSVNNAAMPVPSAYYGVTRSGEVKVRGIEARRRNCPLLVKNMQEEIIAEMGKAADEEDMKGLFHRSGQILKNYLASLDIATKDELAIRVRVNKEIYKVNCAQKAIMGKLSQQGIAVHPGESVSYIIEDSRAKKYALLESFNGMFDRAKYRELLKKACLHLFLPFNLTMTDIESALCGQQRLADYEMEKEISHDHACCSILSIVSESSQARTLR